MQREHTMTEAEMKALKIKDRQRARHLSEAEMKNPTTHEWQAYLEKKNAIEEERLRLSAEERKIQHGKRFSRRTTER
eukprot:4137028-Ditylum_brightwellii.AAC.1